jgi:hypothetical protein
MIFLSNLFESSEARMVSLRLPVSKIALLPMNTHLSQTFLNAALPLFLNHVFIVSGVIVSFNAMTLTSSFCKLKIVS